MKTIKVKFVGFGRNSPSVLLLYHILHEHYDVQLSDNPEYVICSCFAPFYEYCQYDAVRIMNAGENYVPDFNLVDYAISLYPVCFLDRSFYLPICTDAFDHPLKLESRTRLFTEQFVKDKQYFANFIASHDSENGLRSLFFKKISEYKRVESPGRFLNNVDGGTIVSWKDQSKTDFQRKCKFSICFESTKNEGFITEKIVDAFYADSIPIYYGSSTVTDIFNPKAFINCNDFSSFDEVVEYIKLVDQDDSLYLSIINQPILNDPYFFSRKRSELEAFVVHIFDQPLENAYRRSRVFSPKNHEDYLVALKQENKKLKESDIQRVPTVQLVKCVLRRILRRIRMTFTRT